MARRGVLGLVLVAAHGCYGPEWVDPPRPPPQPGSGGVEEGDWSCLRDSIPWPTQLEGPLVRYAGHIVDFSTLDPLPGVRTRACAFADRDCASPLDEGYSDQDGVFSVMVPTGTSGFDGYLEMTGGGIYPTLTFPNPPRTRSVVDALHTKFTVTTAASFRLTLDLVNLQDDPSRGHHSVFTEDCQERLTGGVSLITSAVDGQSSAIYVLHNGPTKAETKTDAEGLVAWINVPPAVGCTVGYVAATSQTVGITRYFTRPGWMSQGVLLPSPYPPGWSCLPYVEH